MQYSKRIRVLTYPRSWGGWEGTRKAYKNEKGNQKIFLQMGKYVCAKTLMAAEKSRKLVEIGYRKILIGWTTM